MFGSIVRPVLKDTLGPTAEGGRLHVRKGDIVLGQCREMHRAFNHPEEFIFDRVKKAREAGKANLRYIPFAGGKGIVRKIRSLIFENGTNLGSCSVLDDFSLTARSRL